MMHHHHRHSSTHPHCLLPSCWFRHPNQSISLLSLRHPPIFFAYNCPSLGLWTWILFKNFLRNHTASKYSLTQLQSGLFRPSSFQTNPHLIAWSTFGFTLTAPTTSPSVFVDLFCHSFKMHILDIHSCFFSVFFFSLYLFFMCHPEHPSLALCRWPRSIGAFDFFFSFDFRISNLRGAYKTKCAKRISLDHFRVTITLYD